VDRHTYDLRATFASRANVCHATGLTVAHLLGHASTQLLPTYVRPRDENTRASIEAMDTARKNQRNDFGIADYPHGTTLATCSSRLAFVNLSIFAHLSESRRSRGRTSFCAPRSLPPP
jgi:hypothetical protein